jgi:clan AA aspartic protease (TIGR02281 family)
VAAPLHLRGIAAGLAVTKAPPVLAALTFIIASRAFAHLAENSHVSTRVLAQLFGLPASVATRFGLKPSDKDRRIILQLADGREIEAHLMKLANVRVGKFTVEDVECAVLSQQAVNAEPLLGMSFLEHFKFEIDAAARKLTMVKVTGSDSPPAKATK